MRMQILDLAQKYSVGLQEVFVCLQVVLPGKKIFFPALDMFFLVCCKYSPETYSQRKESEKRTVEIINYRKFCQLFAVAGNCETSLKKDVSGKGRVSVIVNDSNHFF
jgi:hypothetical protein